MKKYLYENKIRKILEGESYKNLDPQFEELNGDGSIVYWDADLNGEGMEVRTSIIEGGAVLKIEDRLNEVLHFDEVARIRFNPTSGFREFKDALFRKGDK